MGRDSEEADGIAQLDDDEVPFEAVPGRTAPTGNGKPRGRRRKKASSKFIGLFALVYAIGAAGFGAIGRDGALLTWLVAGPLIIVIWRAIRTS